MHPDHAGKSEGSRRDLIEQAREMVRERQRALAEERRALRLRREELLREVGLIDRQLEGLQSRIAGMRDLLLHDFPAAEQGQPAPWEKLGIPAAAAELLQEAGGYLTASQIRAGLEEHGVSAEDTRHLMEILEIARESGEGLLRVDDRHWGREEWAEQARIPMAHRYREGRKPSE